MNAGKTLFALYIDYDTILLNDGVDTFTAILGGEPVEEGELLEVQFMDGSAGTYNVHLNDFIDSSGRPHREAYIDLHVKGVPIEFPITGMLARRI